MKNKVIWIVLLVSIFGLTSAAYAIDTDNDGLDDLVESNTGVYVDQFDTGTDPLLEDTDGDTVMDGPEVNSGSHPLDSTITPSSWKIGDDIRITNALGDSEWPSLVWTGSEYGVSWDDWRDGIWNEIYFARIDASGNKVGTDVRITNDPFGSYHPSLLWNGSEYGVSWDDSRGGNIDIYFTRIDGTGTKIGADMRITTDGSYSYDPSLAWTGMEYGVSWYDGRDGRENEIYFARLDASGAKIGSEVRITNDAITWSFSSLVWTGSDYGLSMGGVYEIYFARLDASGNKIGSEVRIPDDTNGGAHPSLIWTGTEYGVSWKGNGNDIYFARLDASGNKINSDVRITDNGNGLRDPSLIWTGREYGVSWGVNEIYFTRISESGAKIGADLRITNAAGYSEQASLVWTGSEYGVSWEDDRDGNYEIYFARIGIDEDGDGLSNSEELTYGLNPNNYDTDGDGLTDGDEVNLYLTDPSNPDTDNGGKPDGQEVAEGTDPLDASDDVEGSPAPNQNRIKPRINGFDGCNMTFNNNTRGFGANASKIIFLTVPLFMVWIKKRFNRLSRRKGGGNI